MKFVLINSAALPSCDTGEGSVLSVVFSRGCACISPPSRLPSVCGVVFSRVCTYISPPSRLPSVLGVVFSRVCTCVTPPSRLPSVCGVVFSRVCTCISPPSRLPSVCGDCLIWCVPILPSPGVCCLLSKWSTWSMCCLRL